MGCPVLLLLSPPTFDIGYLAETRYRLQKAPVKAFMVFPMSLTEGVWFTEMDRLFQIPAIQLAPHHTCQYHTCSSYFTL